MPEQPEAAAAPPTDQKMSWFPKGSVLRSPRPVLCDSQVAVSLAFEVIEAKIQHARRQECEGTYQQALADVLRIMAHHRSKIGIGRVDEDEEERGPSGLATEWTA